MVLNVDNLETQEIERLATIVESSLTKLSSTGQVVSWRSEEAATEWFALHSEAKTLAETLRAIIKNRN